MFHITKTLRPAWNDIEMGALPHDFFSLVVASRSTLAESVCSHCPSKRLIFQTRACFLASYFAFPALQYDKHQKLATPKP